MPFNTYTFIIFFLICLTIYTLLNDWNLKKITLLVSSYIFYAAWNPVFILLLFFSTFCDWCLAKYIYIAKDKKTRKKFLLISIFVNLVFLGYFKYGDFLLNNIISIFKVWGIYFHPLPMDIILPVGISFYTFQTLSYAVDVYRGKIKPEYSFLNYALYVSFFPQLVAGPIVRANEFLPQCESSRKTTENQIGWGLSLFVIGIFMKVILADTVFAPIVNIVYEDPSSFSSFEIWVAIFSFSGQIFCDFGGYSTCAIGIALCFGFSLPDNFRAPYASIGFKDFWQRWHISLSSWFRDYLYINLGGNRKSDIRTFINLLFTMLIAGLWHGASWMFVIWGGLHGLYLILEKIIKKHLSSRVRYNLPVKLFLILFTYFMVSITWIFFRASELSEVELIVKSLFNNVSLNVSIDGYILSILASVSILVWHVYRRHSTIECFFWLLSPAIRCLLLISQLLIIFLFVPGDDSAFIYFQF